MPLKVLILRTVKFLKVAGSNGHELKKIQKVALHNLDLKGSFD